MSEPIDKVGEIPKPAEAVPPKEEDGKADAAVKPKAKEPTQWDKVAPATKRYSPELLGDIFRLGFRVYIPMAIDQDYSTVDENVHTWGATVRGIFDPKWAVKVDIAGLPVAVSFLPEIEGRFTHLIQSVAVGFSAHLGDPDVISLFLGAKFSANWQMWKANSTFLAPELEGGLQARVASGPNWRFVVELGYGGTLTTVKVTDVAPPMAVHGLFLGGVASF